jgi:hypothetical protein
MTKYPPCSAGHAWENVVRKDTMSCTRTGFPELAGDLQLVSGVGSGGNMSSRLGALDREEKA